MVDFPEYYKITKESPEIAIFCSKSNYSDKIFKKTLRQSHYYPCSQQ
jgi:hypothetical protein